MSSKYSWLVSSHYVTEDGYPNRIAYNPLKILSGSETLPTSPCIFRGSIGEARDIQKKQSGNIVLFMGSRPDSFDCASFMNEIYYKSLNESYWFDTLWRLKKTSSSNFPMFVRSNSGWKVCGGFVANNVGDLNKLKIPDSTLMFCHAPTEIEEEHRFIVVNQKIISGSIYLPDEKPTHHEAWDFAQKAVDAIDNPPDTAYCIDVALTRYRGWKVIELNSVTTAGWYAANVEKCCVMIEAALVEQENSIDE